jgi:dGTPase
MTENRADEGLVPYASLESRSQGRRFAEPGPGYRGEYERDRDRIVHCTAFRRLVYKTQVFVNSRSRWRRSAARLHAGSG